MLIRCMMSDTSEQMPEMLSSKVVEVEDQSEHGDLDLDDDGERRKRSRA